eukprot:CAMPEP_0170560828 /NCGR_PEP_ID=MMETSP0211-20121228/51240_1 /TAXON_ID=311385 /ORGANISM="Pseudokeronopsis sp., Strain OXSARD2" /LENGTH=62 /DNA_ID=CAMNT_0010875561 /DNA_START=18 /DNA_END=206 /DNA_ORIENTATION=-
MTQQYSAYELRNVELAPKEQSKRHEQNKGLYCNIENPWKRRGQKEVIEKSINDFREKEEVKF